MKMKSFSITCSPVKLSQNWNSRRATEKPSHSTEHLNNYRYEKIIVKKEKRKTRNLTDFFFFQKSKAYENSLTFHTNQAFDNPFGWEKWRNPSCHTPFMLEMQKDITTIHRHHHHHHKLKLPRFSKTTTTAQRRRQPCFNSQHRLRDTTTLHAAFYKTVVC